MFMESLIDTLFALMPFLYPFPFIFELYSFYCYKNHIVWKNKYEIGSIQNMDFFKWMWYLSIFFFVNATICMKSFMTSDTNDSRTKRLWFTSSYCFLCLFICFEGIKCGVEKHQAHCCCFYELLNFHLPNSASAESFKKSIVSLSIYVTVYVGPNK